jgi:hypothetical protein
LLYVGVIKQCLGHSVVKFDLFPLEKLYVDNENIDRIGSDLDRLPLKIFVLQTLARSSFHLPRPLDPTYARSRTHDSNFWN